MADFLGPAKQTFYRLDDDGNLIPDVGGALTHYEVGGSTPKDTWQDPEENALNTNPVVLDADGAASIFGSGLYRQVYVDGEGNPVWDRECGNEPPADPTVVNYFDQPFEFLGGDPPIASEVMGVFVFTRACRIPADFAGSYGRQFTAPSATFTITAARGNYATPASLTTIGTIIVATSGAWTWATVGNVAKDFLAGEFIKFTAQVGVDATFADVFWTVTGTVL